MSDVVIAQRLYSSDLRILACRADPDPRFDGRCSKIRVKANGLYAYLCPLRVAAFLAVDQQSLAGLVCSSASEVSS